MKTKDALKVIGLGIVTAAITSCSDGKEKQQQDDKQKAKTEQVSNAQKTIQDLNSHGIPVLKAGEKGKPDSLLQSVEKDGDVYSNPKYKATDDVSKALGIKVAGYDVAEMKINRKDAHRIFGDRLGELNVGDVLKVIGGMVRILDDNARNSIKLKLKYNYENITSKEDNKWDLSFEKGKSADEFGKQADKTEKSSGYWSEVEKKSTIYNGEPIEVSFGVIDQKIVITREGKEYNFDFGDLSKANIVRDAKLPKKPKAPKRKIGDALLARTLADVKKNKR